jgi:hypothetical protein
MWWFGGERDERDEGERESSETGRRLYCCMEEALGTGRIWKEREERGGYIRGAGFVSAIASDLLGIGRKWVKDRTEVIGFDFDSRGEGKGKKDEKEQRGDQIGSCVSFRAAGSHRNLSVGYVALQAAYLVCQPISLSGPSNSRPRTTSQRPRALREFGDQPPLILPLTETAHLSIPSRLSGNLATSTAARSHDRFRLLGCNRFPSSVTTVRSPILSPARNNR